MTEPAAEPTSRDRRALPVVLLGLLVIFVPLFLLPAPDDGPITFVVGFAQAIAAAVGLVVAATGLYSHRTGDLRPAVAAAATVLGLVGVGAVGAIIELRGGLLIPPWIWFLAALLVILGAFAVTHQLVPGPR